MDEREKIAARLLAQAAKDQSAIQKADRRSQRPKPEPAPVQTYCSRCLAMLRGDRSCPRCEHGEMNCYTYCRKCSSVHSGTAPCKAWKPGVCKWCDEVHPEPTADCRCKKCGQHHRDAEGRHTDRCRRD